MKKTKTSIRIKPLKPEMKRNRIKPLKPDEEKKFNSIRAWGWGGYIPHRRTKTKKTADFSSETKEIQRAKSLKLQGKNIQAEVSTS